MALGRSIVQSLIGTAEEIPVITLSPELEQLLQNSLRSMMEGGAGIEPGLAERLQQSLEETHQRMEVEGQPSILLVPPVVRPWLAQFFKRSLPALAVLGYTEVPDDKRIRIVSTIGQ